MAATEAIYASGSLNLPCLVLDQGATIRRRILNLGNDWEEIGIAFAIRVIGNDSLASAMVNESIVSAAPAASRFAFGLKNNNGTLVGQSGCKFIGVFTNGIGSRTGSSVLNSGGFAYINPNAPNSSVGLSYNNTDIENETTRSITLGVPSVGTEQTTNFARIIAFTIRILNRGSSEQKIRFGFRESTGLPAVTSINQALFESRILMVSDFSEINCPHATYDLSDIDCVFIQWPFANNRLLVFGPTSGEVGSPFVMRLS